MRGVAHIWPQEPRRDGDVQEIGAVVEWPGSLWPPRRRRRQRLWFRVPADLPISAEAAGDALLLGSVFGAMRTARVLHLHGTATEGRGESLERLSATWAARAPADYRDVSVRVDVGAPASPPRGPALLAFSGGLDSTYSLLRMTSRLRPAGQGPLGAAVMLLGADIPVTEEEAFREAFARAERITESRGVALVRASTNVRTYKQNWAHSYMAALAGTMGLFRGRYGSGIFAAGMTREEALRWWPQEVTDPPLLSSPAFPFSGDGYEADRVEKLDSLRGWTVALENLRVCFRRGSWTRNCGECFKCRTLRVLARIALGEVPPCVPDAPPAKELEGMAATGDPNLVVRLLQVRTHARARGMNDAWLAPLDGLLVEAGHVDGPSPRR